MAAERPESYFRAFFSPRYSSGGRLPHPPGSVLLRSISSRLLNVGWGFFAQIADVFLAGSYLVKLCINVDGGNPKWNL